MESACLFDSPKPFIPRKGPVMSVIKEWLDNVAGGENTPSELGLLDLAAVGQEMFEFGELAIAGTAMGINGQNLSPLVLGAGIYELETRIRKEIKKKVGLIAYGRGFCIGL